MIRNAPELGTNWAHTLSLYSITRSAPPPVNGGGVPYATPDLRARLGRSRACYGRVYLPECEMQTSTEPSAAGLLPLMRW
jgi:hypothetical protein